MLLLPYWQPQVEGGENWPAQGPVILVANHPTLFDPFVVLAITSRHLDFIVRPEVLRIPILGPLIGLSGTIIVRPGSTALPEALSRLKRGRAVMLFPEGHQTHTLELQHFHRGAAVLATLSGAPVVPLGFSGPEQLSTARGAWVRGGRIRARYGSPLRSQPGEEIEAFNERLRSALAAQLVTEPVAPPVRYPGYRLAQLIWVPSTWLIFKLADWLKPNNRR